MKDKLNNIIVEETRVLENLLKLLEEQCDYIIKKDAFAMEGITSKIESCSRELAKLEVQRRNITGNRAMSEIVKESNDEILEKNHTTIKMMLQNVNLQKDTNDTFIKQQLVYVTNMLNLINPNRKPKTYTLNGKLR